MDVVVIDFGSDSENNIKTFICPGSFYVALTRVKMGSKVYLKSFNTSYVKVNKSIEEKVLAMRRYNPYEFKKIYLDDEVFVNENQEIKLGYLNINGLLDGGHAEYLNADMNLKYLDILILSETKLVKKHSDNKIKDTLSDWKIIARYDCVEEKNIWVS